MKTFISRTATLVKDSSIIGVFQFYHFAIEANINKK